MVRLQCRDVMEPMSIDVSSLNLSPMCPPGLSVSPPGLAEMAAADAEPQKLPSPLAKCNVSLAQENAYLRQLISTSLAAAGGVRSGFPSTGPMREYELLKARADSLSTSAADSDIEMLSDSDTDRTTVVIKGLPNPYSRHALATLLDSHGFSACYDFLYMPHNFQTGLSFGYAFANLASAEDAHRCVASLDGYQAPGSEAGLCLSVSFAEKVQGVEAHIERYRNSPAMHELVPDEMKPALYRGGVRVPFPAPTKAIKVPRSRRR